MNHEKGESQRDTTYVSYLTLQLLRSPGGLVAVESRFGRSSRCSLYQYERQRRYPQ